MRHALFFSASLLQEVSRWFFRVGAAAGTIAKSVSAYGIRLRHFPALQMPQNLVKVQLMDLL